MKSLLLGVALSAFALQNTVGQVLIGPRVGYGATRLYGSGTESSSGSGLVNYTSEVKWRGSATAGLTVVVPLLGKTIGLQPEINYQQAGALRQTKGTVLGINGDYKNDVRLHYVQVPLQARLTFGSEDIRFLINAGPYLGYAVSGKEFANNQTAGNTSTSEETINFDDDDRWKRGDFGGIAGAGLMFGIGKGWLQIDVRYLVGFTELRNPNDSDDDYRPKNQGVIPSVALLFPIGE